MNIFRQLWTSLYSPKEISKVRFQGIGKTITYVFLLVLLSTLPTLIYSSISYKDGVRTFIDAVENELPPFEINDGRLHSETEEPVIFNGEDFDVYLDAGGLMTPEDVELASDNAIALLSEEFVIVGNGSMQAQDYDLMSGFSITDQDILSFSDKMNDLLIVVIILLGILSFVFTAALKFIELLFMALIAKLLAGTFYPKLQYRHFFRLTAYSMTLPTIFFMIMSFLQTAVVGGTLVNWAVTFIMLFLALKEIPSQKKKQP